jgi:hypothetical protein
MQSYTVFFIIVNAVHVSGGFSALHQEFKNYTHSMLLPLAVVANKLDTYQMLYVQFLGSW